MKVEVRSKEIVRPSSPTPQNLRNYKLSFVDQTALNFKVPFVFFYDNPAAISGACHTIDDLKKSLSKTLSLMYPLAGRVKEDKLAIDCNDEGVEFLVADVAENMSALVENPEMEKIKQLLPGAKAYEPRPVGKALIWIQVNRFRCGGLAFGLISSHAIADGSVIANFFKSWATVNRGGAVNGSGFISDHSTIFPPLTDTSPIERKVRMAVEVADPDENYTIKRFVIPANAITQLREELTFRDNRTGSLQRPSKTEALTAFVWAAVMNATHHQTVNYHTLSCMVNLRSRMSPPLPQHCLGNMAMATTVPWTAGKEGTAAVELVPKIRHSLRAINDGVARKMYGEGGLLRAVFAGDDEIVRRKGDDSLSTTLYTSSLCGLPFYDSDFGWGKPRRVVNVMKNSSVLFFDAINGGVEMWMGLPFEVMHTLTQTHHFLGYVSGFPKPKL